MPRSRSEANQKFISIGTAAGGVKIVGNDPAFLEVLEKARKLAGTGLPILLQGETGTGKGFLARAIHHWSRRSDRPFIVLNCGELAQSLAESELFGHTHGAFTGAASAKMGVVKSADRGTLFVDELDSLPRELQPKLLRVTDTGEYRPVGSAHSSGVNVRLISATVSDLAHTGSGVIRPDLFHRLAAATLRLPPLRERRSDIPILARHFLDLARVNHATKCREFSRACMEAMVAYDWLGNIRELSNAIQVACAVGERAVLEARDFPIPLSNPSEISFKSRQRDWQLRDEREYFDAILEQCSGDVSRAAHSAGVTVRTVYRKVKDHALDLDLYRSAQER